MKRFFITLSCIVLFIAIAQAKASTHNFLTVSDIHFDHLAQTVTYGEDTGQALMQNALKKIHRIIQKTHPRFIIYLGDLPAHHATYQNRVIDDAFVLKHLRELAGKHTPLFYVMGNNDALSGDYHSFINRKGLSVLSLDPHHTWPGINATRNCKPNSNKACLISLPYHFKYAFYSAYPLGAQKPLRLIVLNTVAFSPNYKNDYGMSQKNLAQLEINWLATQLQSAKNKNQKVIIAMHIPPGKDSYLNKPMWTMKIKLANQLTIQANFIYLIRHYHSIITAILAAHTHFDQIRMIMSHSSQPIAAITFTPGITPQHGNNPGFKTYYYNPENFKIKFSTTYYTPPTAKNWGNHHYSVKVNFKTLSKKQLIALMNQQYSVKRMDYHPPQGWSAIDNAIFLPKVCKAQIQHPGQNH